LSEIVFECGLKVHRALGPVLLESAYEECLFYELNKTSVHNENKKDYALFTMK
jgi:GxxExxY protein